MTIYTADTPREWREKGGSLAKKLYTEFGLLETLLSGVSATTNTLTITKATLTLTAATKLNLGSPVIDITSGIVEMGSQGSGIALTTDYPFGFDLHVKPTTNITAGTTGRTCGIRMRYEVGGDQTTQISHAAVLGHLRIKKDLADGVHTGIEGYIEADGGAATVISGTSTTQTCAGHFAVELGTGVEVSTGWLTGVTVDSSVHSGATISSAEFAGLRVKKTGSAKDWEYGLHIRDSTTGIDIGTCTTAGISITGTHASAGSIQVGVTGTPISYSTDGDINVAIYSTFTGDVAFFRGLYVRSDYTPAAAGEASVYGIRGHAYLTAGQTHDAGIATDESFCGVHGYVSAEDDTAIFNGAGITVAGVKGEVGGSPTVTEVKAICGVWAKLSVQHAITTGPYTGVYVYAPSSGYPADSAMHLNGYFTSGINFEDADALTNAFEFGTHETTDSAPGGASKYVNVTVGGVAARILAKLVS